MPQLYGIRGIPKGKKKVHKSGSIAWYNKVEEEHQDDNGNTKKKRKAKRREGGGGKETSLSCNPVITSRDQLNRVICRPE